MELVASLARPGGNITGMSAPTADGRQRPLGIAALEDKIIQGSVAELLAWFPAGPQSSRRATTVHAAIMGEQVN